MHSPTDFGAEARALYAAWDLAVDNKDEGALRQLFADDVRVRNITSGLEYSLGGIIRLDLSIEGWSTETVHVSGTAFGEVALSHWSVLVWSEGQDLEAEPATYLLYSSVWRRTNDRWRLVDHIRVSELPR